MKILFFLGFPNPFPGAAWTRIGFFADKFRKMGHKITVVGAFSPQSLGRIGLRYSNSVRILNVCPTLGVESFPSLLLNLLSSAVALIPLMLVTRPDISIISVPTGEPAIGAFIASSLARAKSVIDYRDEWEDYTINKSKSKVNRGAYLLLKALMTRLYARSSRLVAVTKPIARRLTLRGLKDVKIVPNGADTTIFRPYNKKQIRAELGLNKDDFIIVYSGVIGYYYRLDIVVKALAKVNARLTNKIKLLIVGEGPDQAKAFKIANTTGVAKDIICLPTEDDRRVLAQILSSADVGIIPYDDNPLWRNSLPAKFFEYCACGISILATVHVDSILANLIRKSKLGEIAPPMDIEKLSEAIKRLHDDRSFREVAGKKARLLIEQAFDRSKIAEVFLEDIVELSER